MIYDGFRVTETIEGAHPRHPVLNLASGYLLFKEPDGTFTKECPGLMLLGFHLTPEQEATLEPVKFIPRGLDYEIVEEK